MSDLSAVAQIVKSNDYERFLTLLLAPAEKREALYTLYAFHHEIAKTREVVSDTTLGLIRLTWWREAIEEIYAGQSPRAHEIVTPLAKVIKEYNLPQNHFMTMIYAREFDLEDVLPSDLNGLKNYADYTMRPLLSLAALILKGEVPEDTVKPMAQVIALTGLLRATPWHFQAKRCFLPETLLEDAGLDAHMLYDGKGIDALRAVVCDIVWSADTEYRHIKFDRALKPLHMQAALAKQYLDVLRRNDFNVFADAFHRTPPLSMLRLLARFYSNRF